MNYFTGIKMSQRSFINCLVIKIAKRTEDHYGIYGVFSERNGRFALIGDLRMTIVYIIHKFIDPEKKSRLSRIFGYADHTGYHHAVRKIQSNLDDKIAASVEMYNTILQIFIEIFHHEINHEGFSRPQRYRPSPENIPLPDNSQPRENMANLEDSGMAMQVIDRDT